jgi:hypothetical protein
MAGGVTTANFPQAARNLRRSASASNSGVLLLSVMVAPFRKYTHSLCIDQVPTLNHVWLTLPSDRFLDDGNDAAVSEATAAFDPKTPGSECLR